MRHKIRPIPYENPHNSFIELYLSSLKKRGFKLEKFKWWRIRSLFEKDIDFHLHWPEAIYRDSSFLKSLLKAFRFVVFFFLHKANNNRWIFFVHNVVPHQNKGFLRNRIDFIVFKIILKGSDQLIGLSKNTLSDINNEYKVSIHEKYKLIEHFLYPIKTIASREVLSNFLGQNLNFDYILAFGAEKRNKGTGEIIREFSQISNYKLVVVGGSNAEVRNKNVIHIKEFPDSEVFNSLIEHSIGVILNYDRITTSGMFFHCVSLQKVTIVPKLNFFLQTSNEKLSVFYTRPLNQEKLIKILNELKRFEFILDRDFNSVDDFTNQI